MLINKCDREKDFLFYVFCLFCFVLVCHVIRANVLEKIGCIPNSKQAAKKVFHFVPGFPSVKPLFFFRASQ